MEKPVLSKEQIISSLQNPTFAVGFALDNNLNGVIQALNILGLPAKDRLTAFEQLKKLANGDKQKLQTIFDRVGYIDWNPQENYTGGFKDYFKARTSIDKLATANNMPNIVGRFSLDALLSGLGAGLSAYSNVTTSGGNNVPDQNIIAQMEADKAKAEAEGKAKRKKMIIWISIIIAVIILTIILIYIVRKNKETAKTSE